MRQRVLLCTLVLFLGAGCTSEQPVAITTTSSSSAPSDVGNNIDQVVAEVVAVDMAEVESTTSDPLAPLLLTLTSGNFFFTPTTITAKAGQEVVLTFVDGAGGHTFTIDDLAVHIPVVSGQTSSFIAPALPGTYTFYCSSGSHRELGMEGKFIVE